MILYKCLNCNRITNLHDTHCHRCGYKFSNGVLELDTTKYVTNENIKKDIPITKKKWLNAYYEKGKGRFQLR